MSDQNQDIFKLEKIFKNTINVLENSTKDIFSIYQSSSGEIANIKSEIKMVNQEMEEVINKINNMKRKNRTARIQLMEVSRDLENNKEKDIKEAYQKVEDTSVEIAVLKEKEEQLKNRKKELEKRIEKIKNTATKAENLISKMGIVRDYLQGELTNINKHIDDIKEKQKVAMKIIQAQEEERKRVAREIHDGPAQSLANVVFRCEYTLRIIDRDIDQAKEEIINLKDMVRSSVQDVRKIIYDLRPMSLDNLGLLPTLKKYIRKFEKQTDISIQFEVKGKKKSLPPVYEVTIFRLIQEGLNNIHKHADVTEARILFEFSQKKLNILIIDPGRGFDVTKREKERFGLVSMEERCELIGGDIDIKSKKGRGTKIKITIPLPEGE